MNNPETLQSFEISIDINDVVYSELGKLSLESVDEPQEIVWID